MLIYLKERLYEYLIKFEIAADKLLLLVYHTHNLFVLLA